MQGNTQPAQPATLFDFIRPARLIAARRAKFNGAVYEPRFDDARLAGQLADIFNLMKDGQWRTLDEIQMQTGAPQASISAQLRHLRKPRFGSHIVDKRARGDRKDGLWEYRVITRGGGQ